MRILHIITGLGCGGAENTLKNLLTLHQGWADQTVATLDGRRTSLSIECERIGVRVLSLRSIAALWGIIQQVRPALIQAWMYHGNLAGAALGSIVRAPVLWNIRRGGLVRGDSLQLKAVSRACAALSSWAPAGIICCSNAAMRSHVAAGYFARHMTVIPNGVDSNRFCPRPDSRRELRRELAVEDDSFVIGHVGRFTALKDHAAMAAAAAEVSSRRPNVCLVMCGRDVTDDNPQLSATVRRHNLDGKVRLLGYRADVDRVLSAFDVLVCSSLTEGFSNVVAEAMSSGVPVVATNVGENETVIGDTGIVVEAGRPAQIAAACIALRDMGREARLTLGIRARQRITREYDLAGMGSRYRQLYQSCAEVYA